MATDQGVGGSNPLTHAIIKKGICHKAYLFFDVRVRSDSNGFKVSGDHRSPSVGASLGVHRTPRGLRFAPVGAKPRSTGPRAPSHALSARLGSGSRYISCLRLIHFFMNLCCRLHYGIYTCDCQQFLFCSKTPCLL